MDSHNSSTSHHSKASSFHTNLSSPQWLDSLEREFDRAFVHSDLKLSEMESDQGETVHECKEKMTTISGVFAQFAHKTLAVWQRAVDKEEELIDLKDRLATSSAVECALEEESQ